MALCKTSLTPIFIIFCALYYVNGQDNVIELSENTWREMLQDEWMIEFYAPWCPACQALHPVWKELATWGPDLGIKVGQIDVTKSPGLSGRFFVTALPTIYHVLNGEFRQYKGTRDKDSFISFIEDKKWQMVEAVPSWKSPNSIQMSLLSSFFKVSQLLRNIHNHFTEEFGLPTWGSYFIFAVATIILGGLLGLIFVCVIDLVYPPKSALAEKKTSYENNEKTEKISDDDLLDDEYIKDDLYDDRSQSGKGDSESSDKSEPSSPNVKKRKPRKAD